MNSATPKTAPKLGVIIIGRNEGARLVRCLDSVAGYNARIVYVDSNSSDGSPAEAARRGADVVTLSLDTPFTAGRARNVGYKRLMGRHPEIQYVQFIDGDCELAAGWIEAGLEHLHSHPDCAIVCGRRKERFPEHSIYNRLCDIEWNTPIGEADACGGDFLVRAMVFDEIGGFNDSLIAGEEPEMCHRLRKTGRQIHRIDALMTWHDAAMTHFNQWVKRSSRCGYAYAARAALHRHDKPPYCWRENARIVLWALLIPATIALLAILGSPWFLLGFLLYPLQALRIARDVARRHPNAPSIPYAWFVLLGKWPEFYGQTLFLTRWIRGREQRIIEYK